MSHKKLASLLVIPLAVAAIGGAMFVSHQANAQASQLQNQTTVDKPEPGDQPDKPGQADPQGQQDKNRQKDGETND